MSEQRIESLERRVRELEKYLPVSKALIPKSRPHVELSPRCEIEDGKVVAYQDVFIDGVLQNG